TRETQLVPHIPTIAPPLRIYSKTTNTLKHIKNPHKIPIPNHHTNSPPPLLLFQNPALIKLNDHFNPQGPQHKILQNPYNLHILPPQPPNLPPLLHHLHPPLINNPL
ncbi:MetQ/NlpA family ABC transporter substrate-binding protein, partial [Bacillus sp. WP8]|uniref:MetQ/NlpA family ABC transporter substrate-binding protein n=1 Tax=Bacillus sp. WP8 TaxID=756828 RepID=UPI0021B23C44